MPIKNLKQVTLRIKKITWQETIPIRHEVLWPNKTPEFCHVEGDELAQHFGLFIDECLVSVASIYLDNGAARLRKFATLNHYQGRGYGTALLQHILEALKADGVRLFWCDARESAIGFYQQFGLSKEGGRFYKSQVPYFKMSRVMCATS